MAQATPVISPNPKTPSVTEKSSTPTPVNMEVSTQESQKSPTIKTSKKAKPKGTKKPIKKVTKNKKGS